MIWLESGPHKVKWMGLYSAGLHVKWNIKFAYCLHHLTIRIQDIDVVADVDADADVESSEMLNTVSAGNETIQNPIK